jgi:phosphate starvation-inducible protein PhoH and related proteins
MMKKEKQGNVQFNLSLNDEQLIAKDAILKHPYNFVIGNAGSGKTLLSTYIALQELFKSNVERIVITRPTVGTEDIGFLPGTLEEKLEPWLVPIRSNFRKVYNKPEKLKSLEVEKKIEMISLQHFRGQTFENAICILDEFQNLTKSQLRMAVGRLGKGSIMIFCGDFQQIDLKNKNDSAIYDIELLKNSPFVNITELIENHRNEAVSHVLNLLK